VERGGRREEGPKLQNNALDHPFKRSTGLKTLVWSKLLAFIGKKLTFRVNIGPSPLRPPHVHSRDE